MVGMRRALVFLALMVAVGGLSSVPAGVGVEVDLETLNRLLGAVTRSRFDVELAAGTAVTVELQDLKVTGLAPATKDKPNAILTSVTLVAPDIGLRVPLKPRRFPADNEFLIEGADGNVPVTSKLKGIEMGRDTIRFEFDVAVPPKR
jgi:hypothetical protein